MEAAPLILQPPVVGVDETGRRDNDAYFTSPACANALVERLITGGWWRGGSVLEPSCGRGAFVHAIAAATPAPNGIRAVDIDQRRVDELDLVPIARTSNVPVHCSVRDFAKWDGRYDLILGNPPFSHAEPHVRHALSLRSNFGAVAFLLRLAFLESDERVPFWREHPASKIYVLSQRPSFTGGGTDNCAYGFFVWASWWRGPTEVEVISWRAPSPRKGRKRKLDPNDPDAPHPPGIAPFSASGTGENPVGWKEFQDPGEPAEAAP